MDWFRFPPEIRFLILEEVADSLNHHEDTDSHSFKDVADPQSHDEATDSQILQEPIDSQTQDRVSTTRLAMVCEEWQNFFERLIFRRLRLDQSRLEKLRISIAARPSRVAAIQKIFYRVKLVSYEGLDCREEGSEVGKKRNNEAFSSQLLDLLGMLSTWEASTGNGISLQLLVVSPNDNRHRVWEDPQDEDKYPFLFEEDLQKAHTLKDYHSAIPSGFVCNCSLSGLFIDGSLASDALIELESSAIADLPTVPVVKELVIRRNTLRCIAVASVARILSQSFVGLRSFMYEHTTKDPRGRPNPLLLRSQDLNEDLVDHLPHTLRHLSINEWGEIGIGIGSHVDNGLAEALAAGHVFRHLTEFSAGGSVCADTLLRHLASVPLMGENLELLSLRPDSFCSGGPEQPIMETIRAAAIALPHLPKLVMMELWGTQGLGTECIFRYHVDQTTKRPSITWRSGYYAPSELDDLTISCWLDAFARLGRHPLTINIEPFSRASDLYDNWWDGGIGILQNLELQRLIVHPVTMARLDADGV